MSHNNYALQVEVIAASYRSQMLRSANDVVRKGGPVRSRIAQSAVFDAPDRCAGGSERGARGSGLSDADGISPESAVDEKDRRMWTSASRKENIPKLLRRLSIGDALGGFNILRQGRS